jgi:hypothetical protein
MLFLAAISQQELYYISAPKRIIADLVRVYIQPASRAPVARSAAEIKITGENIFRTEPFFTHKGSHWDLFILLMDCSQRDYSGRAFFLFCSGRE